MMRVPEFLFEKVFEISFRQPEPFRATCGGKRAPYRPFSVGEVAVGKGFVLPDKGFVRRIPGDELPLVKAGRIIQQPDDMPGQNRARVAIRTVTEFPAQIVETGGEDATFFAGYVERFCGSIRKNVYSSARFSCTQPSNRSGWNATAHRQEAGSPAYAASGWRQINVPQL